MAQHEDGLTIVAELLSTDSANPYLLDAVGYLRATQHIVAQEKWPDSAARTATSAMRVVGQYAAASNNGELADYVFDQGELPEKWRLYGAAAVVGTVDTHPKWTLWATSEETEEQTNRSQVARAVMLVAKTRIALADFAVAGATVASKQQALATAIAHKRAAFATVDWKRGEEYETAITMEGVEECRLALDSLFAERGVWQEVDSPDPHYPLSAVEGGNQLTAKAAVGELNWRDRRRLKHALGLRDLLAVNALANGEVIPAGAATYNSHLEGNYLLAAAAPKAFVHLGLARRHQLDTYLQVGEIEKAAGMYLYMQKYAHAPELLAAALMMAPYEEALQAVQGAYGVYRGDVSRKLTYVHDYSSAQNWRALPSSEAAAMEPIVQELGAELYTLHEPADRLLASVHQFAIATEIDPTSKESTHALYRLRETWDELERMESYSEKLTDLAAALKSQGITFVNEWKHFSSDNGYIGYGLVASDVGEADGDDPSFFARPYMVEWLRDAALKLNNLHGEERFVFVEHPETKPGEGDHAHETLRRVSIAGNWRERGLPYRELVSAQGTASRIKGSLNSLPHITDRLMALRLASV